jgi:hypothetical protein
MSSEKDVIDAVRQYQEPDLRDAANLEQRGNTSDSSSIEHDM